MDLDRRDPRMLDLPRETDPPRGLEARLVFELRRRGLGSGFSRRLWTRAAAVAGLVVAFGSGFALGARSSESAGHGAETSGESRYLLLLFAGETEREPGAAARRAAEYGAWAKGLAERGRLIAADELSDAELFVGTGGGVRPNGFFLLRARDAEEARTIAASCPHLRHGGLLSLRPIERRD